MRVSLGFVSHQTIKQSQYLFAHHNLIMAFTVSCRTCHKNFKTGSSAKKHHDKSHPGSEFNGGLFKDSRGLPLVSVPAGKQLESAEQFASYKTWLALLEQISGSLHPNGKGKT